MGRKPLTTLEAWLQPLLDRLRPAERRRLACDLARGLRARQAQRIADQRNVDGTPYQPRSARRIPAMAEAHSPQRRQRARVGAMFAKLRTARHLKASGNASVATVEITGRSSRIAAIHQYGLLDSPQRGGLQIRYPARELLGLTAEDESWVEHQLLSRLATPTTEDAS